MARKKKPGGLFGESRQEAERLLSEIGRRVGRLSTIVTDSYCAGSPETRLYQTVLLKLSTLRERLLHRDEVQCDEGPDAAPGEQAAVES